MLMTYKVNAREALRALGIVTDEDVDALDKEGLHALLHKALTYAQNSLSQTDKDQQLNFDVLENWDKHKKLYDDFKLQFSLMEGLTDQPHVVSKHRDITPEYLHFITGRLKDPSFNPFPGRAPAPSIDAAEQQFFDLRQTFWAISRTLDETAGFSLCHYRTCFDTRFVTSKTKPIPVAWSSRF